MRGQAARVGSVRVRRLIALSSRAASWGSALFLVAMMLVTVADVICRAFRAPLAGAYDLVQLFLVGTMFLSIPEVFVRDENIAVDVVDHFAPRAVVALLKALAAAAALVFLALLSWRSVPPAIDAVRFGEVSPDLSIPMAIYCALMIAGITIATLASAGIFVDSVRRLCGVKEWQ